MTANLGAHARAWIEDNWDPEQTLGAWWKSLAASGLAVPEWPSEWYGLGATHRDALAVRSVFRDLGVPGPPAGLGIMLAGPTLLAHGNDEQRARHLGSIVDGTANWCQLFSEPGAGSDLASLSTKAERDGDRWVITGQKVWTSNAHLADRGMLLARTSAGSQGRDGITWFAIDMDQPGIDVRPLREMTGRALFSEVFLDGAYVDLADAVGEIDAGWPVARTTLASERAGLGEGGAVGGAPGRKAGMLDQRCADVVARLRAPRRRSGTAAAMRARAFDAVLAGARARGLDRDPLIRQDLVRLHTLERLAALGARGAPGLAKLRQGAIVRLARDLALRVLGPDGLLAEAEHDEDIAFLSEFALFSPSVSIYGGTDEIQRNQLAERVLGLPH